MIIGIDGYRFLSFFQVIFLFHEGNENGQSFFVMNVVVSLSWAMLLGMEGARMVLGARTPRKDLQGKVTLP